jgi:hypothetical protein
VQDLPERTGVFFNLLFRARPRSEALVGLVPYLPESLLPRALAIGRDIQDDECRSEALAALACRLAQVGSLDQSLAVVREIETASARADALTGIASHLPESSLREALELAREIEEGESRFKALSGMYPFIPAERQELVLREALLAAGHLPQESRSFLGLFVSGHPRSEALTGLAPHLPGSLLLEALAMAREMADGESRAQALAGLLPQPATLSRALLIDLWTRESEGASLLHALARRERKELLLDLRALAPTIAALGGEEAIAQTFHALQDVGRWWP